MRLGISTAAFYGKMETEEAAQVIASLPVDCAEVFLQTPSEYKITFASKVRRLMRPVPCESVHPQGTGFENALMAKSQRQRKDAWDIFLRVLDAGAALGARHYVYHGCFSAQLHALPFMPDENARVLDVMCREAKSRGMVIAWENVFWCQLTTPDRVEAMRRLLPQVRFTLDIKQAMRGGVDPFLFIPAMGNALCNVHVCDWDVAGKLCLPGEGSFDFRKWFAALHAADYQGPVILEPYADLVKDEKGLLSALQALRKAMSQAEKTETGT